MVRPSDENEGEVVPLKVLRQFREFGAAAVTHRKRRPKNRRTGKKPG
jgi:hypothetical protein